MEKKYELTEEMELSDGTIVYRIRALRDFGIVKKGDFGGFVESESNLSHEGNCWISDSAVVCGDALVYENAVLCDNVLVGGNATIAGNATIYDNAVVTGNAIVSGNASLYDEVLVSEDAQVFGYAVLKNNAMACGHAVVQGTLEKNAEVHGLANIMHGSCLDDNAVVTGDANIYGNVIISGDAYLESDKDYFFTKSPDSSIATLTFFKTKNNEIQVNEGYLGKEYTFTLDEFLDKVKGTKYEKEYLVMIEAVKMILGGSES